MKLNTLKETIDNKMKKERCAWAKGVLSYALEMVENIQADQVMNKEPEAEKHAVSDFLNHVEGRKYNISAFWTVNERIAVRRLCNAVSWGGNFDIYNGSIVERLCTPGIIKKYNQGKMQNGPKKNVQWMDVQERAIYEALMEIRFILRNE